jgi:ribosomal protein L37E
MTGILNTVKRCGVRTVHTMNENCFVTSERTREYSGSFFMSNPSLHVMPKVSKLRV